MNFQEQAETLDGWVKRITKFLDDDERLIKVKNDAELLGVGPFKLIKLIMEHTKECAQLDGEWRAEFGCERPKSRAEFIGLAKLLDIDIADASYEVALHSIIAELLKRTPTRLESDFDEQLEQAIMIWNANLKMTKRELEFKMKGANFNHRSYFNTMKKYSDKKYGEGHLRKGNVGSPPLGRH